MIIRPSRAVSGLWPTSFKHAVRNCAVCKACEDDPNKPDQCIYGGPFARNEARQCAKDCHSQSRQGGLAMVTRTGR